MKIPCLRTALILTLATTWPRVLSAGDRFVKGAWVLHVNDTDELDTNDRWWGSGGADWSVLPRLFLGAEVQSAYRSDVIGGKISCRLVPLNALFNVKWKAFSERARPYAGAGVGLASALVWTEVSVPGFGPDFTRHHALGFQAIGGVELRRRWLIELALRRSYSTVTSVQVNPVGPMLSFSAVLGVIW